MSSLTKLASLSPSLFRTRLSSLLRLMKQTMTSAITRISVIRTGIITFIGAADEPVCVSNEPETES